jgi:hypothetical protein
MRTTRDGPGPTAATAWTTTTQPVDLAGRVASALVASVALWLRSGIATGPAFVRVGCRARCGSARPSSARQVGLSPPCRIWGVVPLGSGLAWSAAVESVVVRWCHTGPGVRLGGAVGRCDRRPVGPGCGRVGGRAVRSRDPAVGRSDRRSRKAVASTVVVDGFARSGAVDGVPGVLRRGDSWIARWIAVHGGPVIHRVSALSSNGRGVGSRVVGCRRVRCRGVRGCGSGRDCDRPGVRASRVLRLFCGSARAFGCAAGRVVLPRAGPGGVVPRP